MFDRKFNVILAIFLVLFASVTYLSATNTKLPFFTQAANKTLDINKSVVILSKLEALANSQDTSVITVFARNNKGVGIPNQRVDMATDLGRLSAASMLSDNYGKTEFRLLSDVVGTANLSISIENQTVPSRYSVNFVAN